MENRETTARTLSEAEMAEVIATSNKAVETTVAVEPDDYSTSTSYTVSRLIGVAVVICIIIIIIKTISDNLEKVKFYQNRGEKMPDMIPENKPSKPFVIPTWLICIVFAFSFLILPLILGIYLLRVQSRQLVKLREYETYEIDALRMGTEVMAATLKDEADEYARAVRNSADEYTRAVRNSADEYAKNIRDSAERYVLELKAAVTNERFENLSRDIEINERRIKAQTKKIADLAFLFNAVTNFVGKYNSYIISEDNLDKILAYISDLANAIGEEDLLSPTISLKLHNSDIKELRKKYKDINNSIDKFLTDYDRRYTTKANSTIYNLMVIALRSELQNVLYTLKYERLDNAIISIGEITKKYLAIATDGNKQIAPTMIKFIGIIEGLFIEAVKVEYEYYARQEQIKEQQKAIREQMKQEAEDRKVLEQQQKQVEKEESKYLAEIEKLRKQLAESEADKVEQLNEKMAELQKQLDSVEDKKGQITNLQNGKAGYVYIISNFGSFGENMFKIGMTRRLEPQQRVDELGDASVPFRFDVHSFIFSNDAPTLETSIHKHLNEKRVNKINLRKEFFNVSVDELEDLVNELEPTASFTRTMIAEEYRKSMSMDYVLNDTDEEVVDLEE